MGPLSGRISRLLKEKMTSKQSSNKNLAGLIKPYGGELINLMASDQEAKELKKNSFKTLNCSDRNACDIELLLIGAFSPLNGFMSDIWCKYIRNFNSTWNFLILFIFKRNFFEVYCQAFRKLRIKNNK